MSFKDIVVILSKTFEEITEQEQQTEIIDTDIAGSRFSGAQITTSVIEFIFLPTPQKLQIIMSFPNY